MSQVLRFVAPVAAVTLFSTTAPGQVVDLDGRLNEWPADAMALADGRAVYFRLSLDKVTSLQSSVFQTSLLIDVDA